MASRQSTPVLPDERNLVQRNRNPLAPEMAHIREEMELNDNLVNNLRQQLVLRTARLEEARRNAASKRTQCAQARLRLDTAEAFLAVLSRTEREIRSSATHITASHHSHLEAAAASASVHEQGVAETLDMWREYERDTERRIEDANVAVRFARAAVAGSVEEEADALAREQQCMAIADSVNNWIVEMNTILNMRRSRAIWRVAEDTWRQIFLEVINNSRDIRTEPARFAALALSWVSRGWRAHAQSHRSLWAKIDIDAHAFSAHDAARVRHYLILRGNLPLTLRIWVRSTETQAPLLTEVLTGVGPVRCLLFNGVRVGYGGNRGESAGLIQTIITAVAPPAELVFNFRQHLHEMFQIPDTSMVNLESLVLDNCCLDYPFGDPPVFPLTSLTFEVPSEPHLVYPWGDFYRFFSRSLTRVEKLVILTDFDDNLYPPPVAKSKVMECLTTIKSDFRILLLLYKTRIYAPMLRHLEIARPKIPTGDMDRWSRYANDLQGGASVHTISLLDCNRADWRFFDAYLRDFPHLTDLKLHGNSVELLAPFNMGANRRTPFMALERLYVYKYHRDGNNILAFTRLYHRATTTIPANLGVAYPRVNMLSVQLWNCANISRVVSETLTEIGAFTGGGGMFQPEK